jgi:hypothetical protein
MGYYYSATTATLSEDIVEPRSAKTVGKDFPYDEPTVCYIEVRNDGRVEYGPPDGGYERALAGESRLYAVWPGSWKSDLFTIDDLNEYARAVGIIHDPDRTGLQEHAHEVDWQISPFERNPGASYVLVDLTLRCGCVIRDIRVFAKHVREQLGWDVSVTGGLSGHSVRVRRTTLKR